MPLRPDLLERLRRWDAAPPLRLPAPVDVASEWWAARGPRLRALVVATVAVACLVAAATLGRGGDPGPMREVWVARTLVPAGGDVAAGIEPGRRPQAHLPADAVVVAGPVEGRAALPLLEGQVLTTTHLVPDLTALLRAGEVALPLSSPHLPPVPTGVPVDVLSRSLDGSGRQLAVAARVLAGTAEWVWLAVPEDAAAAIAAADGDGRLSLARRPLRPADAPRPGPAASP